MKNTWTIKKIFLLGLILRVLYACILNTTGAYHGDELTADVGAQIAAGILPVHTQKEISLFDKSINGKVFDSYESTSGRRDVVWVVRSVQSMSLFQLIGEILTNPTLNFPLYYFWVGIFYSLFGYVPLIYRLVSALVGSLSILLLYKIALQMKLTEGTAMFSSLLFACLPIAFTYSGTFYKEPIAQFLLLLALLFYMKERIVFLVAAIGALLFVRPNYAIVFLLLLGLLYISRRPILLKVTGIIFAASLVIPVSAVGVAGRPLDNLVTTLQNTSLLSNVPIFASTFGGFALTNFILGIIGILQPIPFLYGKDAGSINQLVIMWTLDGFEWAYMGPAIISSIYLIYYYRSDIPNYRYFLMFGILTIWICGYGVASIEAVRYRDVLYPLLLLAVGWNHDAFGKIKRLQVISLGFYALFVPGIVYGTIRWFLH